MSTITEEAHYLLNKVIAGVRQNVGEGYTEKIRSKAIKNKTKKTK